MRNKLFISILTMGIAIGSSIGFIVSHSHNQTKKEVQVAQATRQQQEALPAPSVAPGAPLSIVIPKINVHAPVESVGMDNQGRMDVPKNAIDTAWYSPGYKPGMKGNAVIDGHLDRVTGAPAVFWNLKELTLGDSIIVTENNGKSYT